MKKLSLLFVVFLLAFTVNSCKKINDKKMTVVRECTGTYLKHLGKLYTVCNYEILSEYSEGEKIEVDVRKVKKCTNEFPALPCMTIPPKTNGAVEITKIK